MAEEKETKTKRAYSHDELGIFFQVQDHANDIIESLADLGRTLESNGSIKGFKKLAALPPRAAKNLQKITDAYEAAITMDKDRRMTEAEKLRAEKARIDEQLKELTGVSDAP